LEIRAFFINHLASLKRIVKVEAFQLADEFKAFLLGRRYVGAALCLGRAPRSAISRRISFCG